MIVPMTRVGLLVPAADAGAFLRDLQTLGIFQGDDRVDEVSDRVIDLEKKLQKLRTVHQHLVKIALDHKIPLASLTYKGPLEELAEEVEALLKQREEALAEFDGVEVLWNTWRPWGAFDPEKIRSLATRGIHVGLWTCLQSQWKTIGDTLWNRWIYFDEVARDKGRVYFCTVSTRQEEVPPLPADQLSLPTRSPREMELAFIDCFGLLEGADVRLKELSGFRDALAVRIAQLEDELNLELHRDNLVSGAGGEVVSISGWVATENKPRLEAFVDQRLAVGLTEKPHHHDHPPIQLRNNPFARLFEPILGIFSLPSYHEVDPTPWFAPFYALFFGLCLGDWGYGLLLFLVAFPAALALKNREAKALASLGVVLSLAAIVTGLILDDTFGVKLSHEPHLEGSIITALGFLKNQNDAMLFPLLLGTVHLTLGFLLRVVNQVRHYGPQGAMAPLGTLSLMLGGVMALVGLVAPELRIGPFLVGDWLKALPVLTWQFLVFGGLFLLLLFNGLENRTPVYLRPLTGLWKLYEVVTGIPGDLLSYLRLFALGLAGGLLGEAVNKIALEVVGTSSLGAIIGAAVILVIGHGLNLGIGLLSAFVHSLRLTFVEFYKAAEFTGGGKPFKPLSRR